MNRQGPVMDTHFHLGVNPLIYFDEEDLMSWMDENAIDIQVIMQVNEGTVHQTPEWNPYIGNDWISSVQHRFPDRVFGLGGVFPWWQPPTHYLSGPKEGEPFDLVTRNPVLEEVERIVLDLGLHGLKVHPLEHFHQVNNPYIMNPIFEKLTQLQRKTGRRLMVFVHAAGDSIGNTPEAMADIAGQFPELLFVAAHSGYRWATPTVAHTMAKCENVMLDLTTMACPYMMRQCYKIYGAKKFCAGTDGPFATVAVKNAIVNSLTQDEEERAMILGGNLAEYFGLNKV